MPPQVCIIGARRTPFGRFLGGLARRSALELAVHAGRAALGSARPEEVDLVVLGNVLSAGQGMNLARQAGVALGLPLATPAFTVNMMCASGLQAVALGAQAIRAGEARVALCGGVESMSNAPYLLDRVRAGYRIGHGVLVDSLLNDGLVDSFSREHMALLVERLAREFGLSRAEQDAFALRSHRRCVEAVGAGRYAAELAPMADLDRDEHPRADASLGRLAALKPAFDPNGAVTAGNASGINDGAAALLLASPDRAGALGLKPMARIIASASAGVDPRLMGLGPIPAVRKVLERAKLAVADLDLIELNEAFAVQTLAVMDELGLPDDRTNVNGGAIALGHPLGCSGARIMTTLLHEMKRRYRQGAATSPYGLATMCVGVGQGVATIVEWIGE